MTASFPFAEMTAQAGPFKGVDRQGCVFLIVRLGEVGKLPLCAYWTSREGVRSSLLGEGWCLPLLESRLVPLERSQVDFYQPDGLKRTLTRGRKDSRNLSSGAWFGREEGEGDVRLSADFGPQAGKIEVGFRGGRLANLRCAEGSFGFSYRGREIAKVTGDGGTLLSVERDAHNADRVVFRMSGSTAVCERNGNELTIVAADGSRHSFVQGMDDENAKLVADNLKPPEKSATATTEVPVPYSWLATYYPLARVSDYENLANGNGINGCPVWHSYVAGLNPTNATSEFRAVITIVDGKPVVSYTPELDADRKAEREYTVLGKRRLTDADWTDVTDDNILGFEFFKVRVRMR